MNVTYVFPSSEKISADPNEGAAPAGAAVLPSAAVEARMEPAAAIGLTPPPDDGQPAQTPPLLLTNQPASLKTPEHAEPQNAPAPADTIVKEPPKPASTQTTYGAPSVHHNTLPVAWTPPNSRLILVARSRGGMGATSVAVNLAIELQDRRGLFSSAPQRKVALVDLDLQFGTAGSFLDIEDRGGLLALSRLADEPDKQAVRNAMLPHRSGVKILPAPRKAIPLDALDGVRVGAIIDGLMAENDYVVVDLPPALVYWLEPLLRRADRLLMVTDLAVPSVTCARRLIDMMREDNADLTVDIVISREHKPLFQRQVHRNVATALGEPLRHWLPEETRLSRQAVDRGEPLVELAPRCPWSRALRALAKEIEASVKPPKSSKKGDI